ncbi:MAG: acetoacetate--CoA ligase, partial [Proteobacteria bacterium]|nr:acetoacetate--CoA ligase [Pseudomonadota bacterium]
MQRFLQEQAHRLEKPEYEALYRWSLDRNAEFWAAYWEFSGIRAMTPYRSVLTGPDRMPGARWFEGARLNYADNLLRPEHRGTALVFYSERGDRIEMSWDELRRDVAALARALRSMGVGEGDRVAGLLPNRPEAVVAMLACASLGALWSSCSPDFGVGAVLDRFGQIRPRVLFATDGYLYNGKTIDCRPALARVAERIDSLEAVIVIGYVEPEPNITGVPGARRYVDILASASNKEPSGTGASGMGVSGAWTSGADASKSEAGDAEAPEFKALPFSHPLYIMYSSGTTGVPKCIVHGAGGTLIQHLKELQLHCDIKPGDAVFYFTTTGWMMWNWMVSALALGATLVLFDGSPFHPDPGVLWRIAERERLAVFGTSAKYLSALEKSSYRPAEHVRLPRLASVLSTGSPLAPSSFDFVYEHIKEDLQLSSIAGGTDIIACFISGNPMLPVYRGELQCSALGLAVDVFDDRGRPVRGQKGELVCTAPFPSMPVSFWNDPGDAMYRAAYFERFPGVWCHGDYVEMTPNGGFVFHGRSDAILNPGGVRIGTSEIYRIVENFEEVAEAIAVGQEWEGDVRVVLFVRTQPGYRLDDGLVERIRLAVRRDASPRHVPAKVLETPDIPRTRSGKIVELAVRDVIHGREAVNADALANPEALDYFRNRAELAL